MAEKNFKKVYIQEEKKADKTITGTVIKVSSKGEIYVDIK